MTTVRLLPGFGFVQETDGKVRLLPRFGFVLETTGGTPTNITCAQATWAWSGQASGVNAKTMVGLAQAAWLATAAAAAINAKTMIQLAQAAWQWFGISIGGAAGAVYQNFMLFFGIGP